MQHHGNRRDCRCRQHGLRHPYRPCIAPEFDGPTQCIVADDEGAAASVVEPDGVRRDRVRIPFPHEPRLHRLERARHLEAFAHAQEAGARIVRQACDEVAVQHSKIEICLDRDGGHAGAPLVAGYRDTIDDRFRDAWTGSQHRRYFRRRHVLAFPAERVPHAIDEIVVACAVLAHQVARAKPAIPRHKDVVQHFACGGFDVRVAVEMAGVRASGPAI